MDRYIQENPNWLPIIGETEPIGGDNPYHRCKICRRSVPELSSYDHYIGCKYRSIPKINEQTINS